MDILGLRVPLKQPTNTTRFHNSQAETCLNGINIDIHKEIGSSQWKQLKDRLLHTSLALSFQPEGCIERQRRAITEKAPRQSGIKTSSSAKE